MFWGTYLRKEKPSLAICSSCFSRRGCSGSHIGLWELSHLQFSMNFQKVLEWSCSSMTNGLRALPTQTKWCWNTLCFSVLVLLLSSFKAPLTLNNLRVLHYSPGWKWSSSSSRNFRASQRVFSSIHFGLVDFSEPKGANLSSILHHEPHYTHIHTLHGGLY